VTQAAHGGSPHYDACDYLGSADTWSTSFSYLDAAVFLIDSSARSFARFSNRKHEWQQWRKATAVNGPTRLDLKVLGGAHSSLSED
jgi:hypothetical protein